MSDSSNILADRIIIGSGFVPVIDISAARSGDPNMRQLTAEFIDATCRESGFLVIVGHGIPQTTIDNIYHVSQAFFAQSKEQKNLIERVPSDLFTRGYTSGGSLDASNNDVDISAAHKLPDLMERFIYNPMGDPDAQKYISWPKGKYADGNMLWMPNQWPDIPKFKEAFFDYFQHLQDLAFDLMRLFALGLNLPETWFDDKFNQRVAQLIVNHYPAQTTTPLPGQVRLGRHSDWGNLTILFQDDKASGLQVLDKEGNWVDVPPIPGSYVVNIGDLMAIWTNNTWVSTVHRVQNPPAHLANTERLSIPFFHQPNHDAMIECIPSCTNADNPPRHTPVISGEYLLDKYARAYGGY